MRSYWSCRPKYEYDNLHRLTHVTYDSLAWIRYEYDAAYSPRTVFVVLTVECPPGSCEPWDMNYDGMVSLIGDAPPFVDCVYFGDCDCPGPGCLCPGDCNHSGYLSIVGDLTCFVNCVYFGSCPRGGSEPRRPDLPGHRRSAAQSTAT